MKCDRGGVIPSVNHFLTKIWENCISSFVLSLFLEENNGNIFSPVVRVGGQSRGLLDL